MSPEQTALDKARAFAARLDISGLRILEAGPIEVEPVDGMLHVKCKLRVMDRDGGGPIDTFVDFKIQDEFFLNDSGRDLAFFIGQMIAQRGLAHEFYEHFKFDGVRLRDEHAPVKEAGTP